MNTPGMVTVVEESEDNHGRRISMTSADPKLYTTTFVTPLKKPKRNEFSWPTPIMFQRLIDVKVYQNMKETGAVVTAVCLAAIVFGSLAEPTLLNCLQMLQKITWWFLPYLLIITLFYWTGSYLQAARISFLWKHLVLFCVFVEVSSEILSRVLGGQTSNVLSLLVFPSFSLILGYLLSSNPSTFIMALVGLSRLLLFALFREKIVGGLKMTIVFVHLAWNAGLYLGFLFTFKNEFVPEAAEVNNPLLGNKIPVIRKRRGSSVDSNISSGGLSAFSATASRRRTSMPLLGLPNRRVSVTSLDLTTLGEAHGMIVDLLADSSLPQSVSGVLRIISDMLSPLLQQNFSRNSFSSPLVTVLEKAQVQVDEASVKDQPDLKDDTPLSLKNRLSRQLGVGARRMSNSYTTTTSATGMPSLDIEYRRGSASNTQDDRASRTPSPKPNRAKSYAGLYHSPDTRREFIKSRSFCQPSPPVVRRNSLLKEQIDGEEGDSIFRTELSCSESNFINDGDEDLFANENSDSEATSSKTDDSQRNEEPDSTSVDDSTNQSQKPDPESIISKKSQSNHIESNSLPLATKPESRKSPTMNRKLDTLNVNQLATTPVRKNSRDESANMKRPSRDGSRRGSSASPAMVQSFEIQAEMATATSLDCKNDLDRILDWAFPIFDLSEKCHVLTQVAYRIFQNRGFFQKFKIQPETFFRYFRTLESGYHDIPYHNQIHAADVLQGTYYFTNHRIPGFSSPGECNSRRGSFDNDKVLRLAEPKDNEDVYGCLSNVFPDLELMALYTAAAMHDFDHPGRTNAFLVATLNPKALLYNDRSVLENHHAAAAWALLLSDPAMNFLSSLDAFDFKRFRFIVVEEILSTDLKKHFDFLTEWNAKISDQGGGLNWSSESDRLMVGQMCIKLSDISGPTKRWDIHYKWTQRIVEEFYMQGDAEASQGMPISPYMDRNQPRLPQLQDSFIKHLVGPLYNAYSRAGLIPGEWVERDDDLDDDNDDDDCDDGSNNSYANDSMSERSEDDENDGKALNGIDKSVETKRRKVIFCQITENINNNIERWQQIVSAEAIQKGLEDKLEDKTKSENKLENSRNDTIEEEEENDCVSCNSQN